MAQEEYPALWWYPWLVLGTMIALVIANAPKGEDLP